MLVSVILAAGKGTRMLSDLPKVLHPLLGEPLLGHVLEAVESLQPAHKVVVVGYQRQEVERAYPARGITWAWQDQQLGTAHAAHVGVEATAQIPGLGSDFNVLVVNGDLPLLRAETLQALLDRHMASGPRETPAAATILTCVKSNPAGYGRVIRRDGDVWDIIEEKDADPETRRLPEINVGVYVFRALAFRQFYAQIGRQNAQGELYLTDVVVKTAQAGRRVSTFTVPDEREVAQVNDRQELALATEILRERLLKEYMRKGVTIYDPSSTYIEKGVRIGQDTQILPFTVIERDVEIGPRCEIGPFSHLRPGTRLEDGVSIGNFVEIKNSVLGRGTKARHLSYVGDGLVGQDVNVGAGTIFANFDGKAKNVTVVKDRASLGSGTVLVAPITIGEGAVTGAGSVVLKNQDVPDGALAVGVPAKLKGSPGTSPQAPAEKAGRAEESRSHALRAKPAITKKD